MKKALNYDKIGEDAVKCNLCPHLCTISVNSKGVCGVRKNSGGELYSEFYGKVSALNSDPIEKKPIYHFYPGNNILSVGSIGCNFKCNFCQNWEISQPASENQKSLQDFSPESIVNLALKHNSFGIAYTYNEPTVWIEYMQDIARLSKNNDLKNVVVSNGFINNKPLKELVKYIDAFNIDLKAFDTNFYKTYASARLEPVRLSLELIKDSGKHLEITNLIVPGLNDDPDTFQKMVRWISEKLGKDTVLHLSRYHPAYKLNIENTPIQKLYELYNIAKSKLDHVYLGNVNSDIGRDTYCSKCRNLLIRRSGYITDICGIDDTGQCKKCKHSDIVCN